MKTFNAKIAGFIGITAIIVLSTTHLVAQDDLYYNPSKKATNNQVAPASQLKDTSGMTDYEKYRAMRDAEAGKVKKNNGDTTANREEVAKQKGMERYSGNQNSSVQPVDNQSYSSDQSSDSDGTTIVNNNYYSNDNDYRYSRYRSFYFDYYYDPFYYSSYDPYFYGSWGWPGFGIGFFNPFFSFGFYDPWGYYGYSPYYWNRPSYYSYWNGYGNGYWNGYSSNYNRGTIYSSGGARRTMGGYRAGTNMGNNLGYNNNKIGYTPVNRRTVSGNSTTNATQTRMNVSDDSRRKAVWQSYSAPNVNEGSTRRNASNSATIQTTRIETGSSRRSAGNYTPSYSLPRTQARSIYNSGGNNTNRRYSSENSNNAYSQPTNQNSGSRRSHSDDSYTPSRTYESTGTATPTRSTSSSGGESRRSSGSSYSGSSSSGSSHSSSGSSSGGSSGGGGGRRR